VLLTPEKPFRRILTGAIIREIRRKGKFILFDLTSGDTLTVHLRMTGQFLLSDPGRPIDKHTHVVFDLGPGERQLRYRDVRKFGRLGIQSREGDATGSLEGLAPDPFELDAEGFYRRLRQKNRALKPLLLDQRVVSGLGNIYVDESLHRAGLHPLTPAGALDREQARYLWRLIRAVLRQAIRAKGTTVSDYRGPEGIVGGFQRFLRVYDCTGDPCRVCRTPIEKTRVGGRGTHLCPVCQKREKPRTIRP
jgi:formamidopyrimidine-DNA glycosylase